MITDFFFRIVYFFLASIIGLFPQSAGFPPEAHAAIATIGGYFGLFSPILPISTLLTALILVFSIEIGVFAFRTLKWIIAHLPFIGGRG